MDTWDFLFIDKLKPKKTISAPNCSNKKNEHGKELPELQEQKKKKGEECWLKIV